MQLWKSQHAEECGAAHPELSSAAGELSKTGPLPGVSRNASSTTELDTRTHKPAISMTIQLKVETNCTKSNMESIGVV